MAEALAPKLGKPIQREDRKMTYRVISIQKWDGKQSVKFFESYDEARKVAKYLSTKNSRENVTIRDEHGIKCSF